MSLNTTQSGSNYRFGRNQTYNPGWKWMRKFTTNVDEEKLIASSQILDLPEHKSNTSVFATELHLNFLISWIPETEKPTVYVEYSNNQEHLIYKAKQMAIGKLYHITWKGKKIALRKTQESTVQILELI